MITSNSEITPDAVALHYDELDRFYREIWGEHVHHGLWLNGDESPREAVRKLVEMVAREARIGHGTRVCDIGCGYGAAARMLAAEFGAAVTGITISRAQFNVTQVSDLLARGEQVGDLCHDEGVRAPRFLHGD